MLDEKVDSLEQAVQLTVGAASVCWENPAGAGVFDSEKAIQISDALVAWIRGRYFTPTAEPEHNLIIEHGDCEFWASCSCGTKLGPPTRPDQSFDVLALRWERHVMGRSST